MHSRRYTLWLAALGLTWCMVNVCPMAAATGLDEAPSGALGVPPESVPDGWPDEGREDQDINLVLRRYFDKDEPSGLKKLKSLLQLQAGQVEPHTGTGELVSGHKSTRNVQAQPVFMRLPPRFGKRNNCNVNCPPVLARCRY